MAKSILFRKRIERKYTSNNDLPRVKRIEEIIKIVVEAKKVWTSPTSWGIYRFFVTYEYNGVVYRQKSIEFGVFLFSFKNKTIYNCTGKRSKSGKVSCDQIFCIEKIALFFILAGVGSFFNRRF